MTLIVGCALCDNAPEVPVMVKLEAPGAALAAAERVNCDVPLPPETDAGLNAPLKPVVKFDLERLTVPVNPLSGEILTVYATLDPWATFCDIGETEREKSALAPCTFSIALAVMPL